MVAHFRGGSRPAVHQVCAPLFSETAQCVAIIVPCVVLLCYYFIYVLQALAGFKGAYMVIVRAQFAIAGVSRLTIFASYVSVFW